VTTYKVEIAGNLFPIDKSNSLRIALERLTLSRTGQRRLELAIRDSRVADRVGLGSRVRFFANQKIVFTGRVETRETIFDAGGTAERVVATGPFDWSGFVRVTDEAGVPCRQFSQTTVGGVIRTLMTQHGGDLARLMATPLAYDADTLTAMTEPVEYLRIENQNFNQVVCNLLNMGGYGLFIDPKTQAWQFYQPEKLPTYELNLYRRSSHPLKSFRYSSSLVDRCSAVRLVSQRKVAGGFSPALPAWESALESQWRLRHARYASPDTQTPDESAWVYRRFSYGGIESLLEDFPVELVQKVPTETGWTYEIIETLPADRANRYLVAKNPGLATPEGRRVNGRNAMTPGKSLAGEVYVRYRYYLNEPTASVRYPEQGFAGQVMETGNLAAETAVYVTDWRLMNEAVARREWHRGSRMNPKLELTIGGELIGELFTSASRIFPRLVGLVDLPKGEWFATETLEYDFLQRQCKMTLKRG